MKTVLITGASSGLGRATAEYLSSKGFDVIGTSRNPQKVETSIELIKLDVSDESSVEKAVTDFIEKKGKIDVLVNNAGYGLSGPIEETSLAEAKAQLDVNFFGAVLMTQAVLPHMRANNGGIIINISSIGGLTGMPFQAFYSASKFALEGFTEALRIEMRSSDIQVVNINPGDYKTSCTQNRIIVKGLTDTYREQFEKVLSIYEHDEQNGSDPKQVALLVERLIRKGKGYKVRYLTGSLFQKIAIRSKKILSSKLFERVVVAVYKQ
ncbi:MAG: SDR family oxidoreductase [Bacteroidota bacterium]